MTRTRIFAEKKIVICIDKLFVQLKMEKYSLRSLIYQRVSLCRESVIAKLAYNRNPNYLKNSDLSYIQHDVG